MISADHAYSWLTKDTLDEWRVVVNESRAPEYEELNLSMSDCLSQILLRSIRCWIFPDHFLPSRPFSIRGRNNDPTDHRLFQGPTSDHVGCRADESQSLSHHEREAHRHTSLIQRHNLLLRPVRCTNKLQEG